MNRDVEITGYDRNIAQGFLSRSDRNLGKEVEIGNKKTSYDTEHVLREAYDKAYKENPGARASLRCELRKQGYKGI